MTGCDQKNRMAIVCLRIHRPGRKITMKGEDRVAHEAAEADLMLENPGTRGVPYMTAR